MRASDAREAIVPYRAYSIGAGLFTHHRWAPPHRLLPSTHTRGSTYLNQKQDVIRVMMPENPCVREERPRAR